MTPEQLKALAIAKAKRRRAEAESGTAAPVVNAMPHAPTPAAPVVATQINGTNASNDFLDLSVPGADTGRDGVQPVQYREPTLEDRIMGGLDYVDNTGANLNAGVRQGMTTVLGLPVDLINASPMLANLLPGVDGVGPISEYPAGGSRMFDDMSMLGGVTKQFGVNLDAPEPTDGFQRVARRLGFELGANAVPVGGALARGLNLSKEVIPQMSGLDRYLAAPAGNPASFIRQGAEDATASGAGAAVAGALGRGLNAAKGAIPPASVLERHLVEPAAINPVNFVRREAEGATAAGIGAGVANEAVGAPQDGDNFWSDFIGSLSGVGTYGAGKAVLGAGGNLISAATGSPRFMDDVAGQEVADRLINNSTQMADQAARRGGQLDTSDLAAQLRQPAAIEEAVPGYRANIGDRTQDPGLTTFAFNQDAVSPGAANARNVGNQGAVNARMSGLEPGGDPARFRAGLQNGVDQQIADAVSAEDIARATFGEASQQVQPGLRDATARGSSIRAGLQDANDANSRRVSDLYAPINNATERVDIGPLRDQFDQIDESLPLNDRERFRPAEANVPARLAPPAAAPVEAPIDTGLLDASGRPIMREPPAPEPVDSTVPLNEVTAMRGGLTDDIRGQRAAGQKQAARVGDKYRSAIDDFTDAAVPDNLRTQLDEARDARRDHGDRFERPGTGIAETLRPREGGGYQMDDAAVPGRFAQPDQGRLNDLNSLLKEAGSDARVRDGLADEVLSDVQSRGLIDRPDQLKKYLDDRNVLLSEFPELRTSLERAGVARRDLATAEQASKDTTTRLTTPGRSATASYLKFGDEDPAQAIRTVTTAPKPREAAKELLKAAGDTPQARQDARSALWTEVQRRGKEQAPGMTGETRWNGKRLRDLFNDPKTSAVADELWSDKPEDLADIRNVFDALAKAEGSTRARAAGSSGTAQSLSGKFDPSLSAASIASRARSVNRGVLSPTVAVIDVLSTWLRGRSAQVQSRAIDTLASSVVNNPGLAADLLEKYNPATAAARRRRITQKYGVRATQLLNLLDEADGNEDDDPVTAAATRRDPVEVTVKGDADSLVDDVMR